MRPEECLWAPRIASFVLMMALFMVVLFSNHPSGGRVAAEAVFTAQEACDSLDFANSQERYYSKTDFIVHSRVAETVGNLLSVFYNEDQDSWSISPEDLKEIVMSNIHAVEGTLIYGSAIAFEPNVWRQTAGLPKGVPYPAASNACLMTTMMNQSSSYCESIHKNLTSDDYQIHTLMTTPQNETLYCPYAYQGSPEEIAFAKCSKETQEYCPSMDLARAYDYSDITNPDVEWYTAPRCLFFSENMTSGYWTSPYFDAGAGNINMVTFSQPIIKGNKFLGIATIDIKVDDLCYGNQCENACPAEDYNYTVSDCFGKSGSRTITYSTSNPSCFIDTNAISTLSCSYVPVSSSIGIVTLTLGSIGAFVCLVVLIILICKRKSSLMKASQVRISCGFVLSAFLANIGMFALVGGRTNAKCKIEYWALVLPITMLLAFLFGKVYRAYVVFMAAQKFQRVQVTDRELFLKISLVILIQIILLLIWTFVEDSSVELVTMNESVDPRYCAGIGCFPTKEECVENYNIVGIFSVIYLGILVVIGCILSFQSRKLPNCFSEAQYVMLAMYSVALMAIMMGIVAAVADLSVSAKTILLTFAIFVTATGTVLLVFVPKFIKIFSLPEEEIERGLRETVRSHAQRHSVSSQQAEGGSGTFGGSLQNQRRSSVDTNGSTEEI